MTVEVYLRDRSSGRIHIGIRRGRQLLTDEADNLDDAGERDEIAIDESRERRARRPVPALLR